MSSPAASPAPADELFVRALTATEAQAARVEDMLQALNSSAPAFWEPGAGEHLTVRVEDAEIRVIHIRPERPEAVRPVVFVPGWGVVPAGFQAFYSALHGKAELYYLETREKASSRILSRQADMSVSQSARDIREAIKALGLFEREDFVLVGSCWGSAIILQGLIEGVIEAPTIVTVDPMHYLWFPKWILRYVSPFAPVFVAQLLKPVFRRTLIGDMKEKTQKGRIDRFIDEADPRKWKKSADAAKDFELYGHLGSVSREIFVFNGTNDKVHDQRDYPRIARELPRGRFFYLEADESQRERLMALAALEFAKVRREAGVPPSLREFEKAVR